MDGWNKGKGLVVDCKAMPETFKGDQKNASGYVAEINISPGRESNHDTVLFFLA